MKNNIVEKISLTLLLEVEEPIDLSLFDMYLD